VEQAATRAAAGVAPSWFAQSTAGDSWLLASARATTGARPDIAARKAKATDEIFTGMSCLLDVSA
jgi:hypothetical protein